MGMALGGGASITTLHVSSHAMAGHESSAVDAHALADSSAHPKSQLRRFMAVMGRFPAPRVLCPARGPEVPDKTPQRRRSPILGACVDP